MPILLASFPIAQEGRTVLKKPAINFANNGQGRNFVPLFWVLRCAPEMKSVTTYTNAFRIHILKNCAVIKENETRRLI